MADKFKANIWIAGPAAVIITGVYVFMGLSLEASAAAEAVDWLRLTPTSWSSSWQSAG